MYSNTQIICQVDPGVGVGFAFYFRAYFWVNAGFPVGFSAPVVYKVRRMWAHPVWDWWRIGALEGWKRSVHPAWILHAGPLSLCTLLCRLHPRMSQVLSNSLPWDLVLSVPVTLSSGPQVAPTTLPVVGGPITITGRHFGLQQCLEPSLGSLVWVFITQPPALNSTNSSASATAASAASGTTSLSTSYTVAQLHTLALSLRPARVPCAVTNWTSESIECLVPPGLDAEVTPHPHSASLPTPSPPNPSVYHVRECTAS